MSKELDRVLAAARALAVGIGDIVQLRNALKDFDGIDGPIGPQETVTTTKTGPSGPAPEQSQSDLKKEIQASLDDVQKMESFGTAAALGRAKQHLLRIQFIERETRQSSSIQQALKDLAICVVQMRYRMMMDPDSREAADRLKEQFKIELP